MDRFLANLERDIKRLRKKNSEWSKVFNPIVTLNNEGIAYEKRGEIDQAIKVYEKCLIHMYEHIGGEHLRSFAWHSPDRLRVLYKKMNSPKQKPFLEEFIYKCKSHSIEVPEIYTRQLDRL